MIFPDHRSSNKLLKLWLPSNKANNPLISLQQCRDLSLVHSGAIFLELGKAGLGVVIHDSQGNMIASLSEQAPLPFSSDIVEAMAASWALAFA